MRDWIPEGEVASDTSGGGFRDWIPQEEIDAKVAALKKQKKATVVEPKEDAKSTRGSSTTKGKKKTSKR
jgi:DNA-directed RNA polymerase delta subunit